MLTAEARAKGLVSRRTPAEREAEHSRLLERVPESQRARVAKQAAAVPEHHRKLYLRAAVGLANRPEVMRAKCLDCCAWQKREVILCTARGCPSWAVRPWRERARETAEAEARALETEGLHKSAAVLRAFFLGGEPGVSGSAVGTLDQGNSLKERGQPPSDEVQGGDERLGASTP